MRWTWYARYNWSNQKFYATHTVYNSNLQRASQTMDLQYYLMNPNNDANIRVDHISHNTLDNRRKNLRTLTNDENTKNRKSKNKNNKSGYRNVSWDGNKWIVQVQVNGKNTCVGRFKENELEEAKICAEAMREKYYGEFAGKN